jgi:hypothetical protein
MYYKKYSQEIIDRLVNVAASIPPFVKPSVHLNRLYRTVSIGMYDSLQANQTYIKNLKISFSKKEALQRLEQEANEVLSVLFTKVIADIEDFENKSIEDKMSSITQYKFLDVSPYNYITLEKNMTTDASEETLNYIHLTKPLRKDFREKYNTEIHLLDKIVFKAKLLTN